MIPPGFLHDLLARIDIVEVVGRHVQLKKAGINHKGLCPFHGEKTPSFIVSPSRQTYHCFGCGAHGDAIRFLVDHLGMGFIDAVQDLAQQAGLTVPDDDRSPQQRAAELARKERQASLTELLEQACTHYRAQLKTTPRAVDYLKRRGLSGQIAARYGLGYAPTGWRPLASCFARYDDPGLVEAGLVILHTEESAEERRYDRFRDRIMFPIRNARGDIIGFGGRVIDQGEPKYLNSPETPVFSKGRELYGLYEGRQAIRAAGHVLVVEGYMDVVALAQLGLGHAVATLGTACSSEHVQQLFRHTEQIVFSFDGDSAGRRAAQRAMEAALPFATDTRSVRFLFLPPEHDPDSYVREHGAAGFTDAVERAVPLSRQLIAAASQGCDLAESEGRARMLSQARPWWATLPDGALKAQLLGELAATAGLDVPALKSVWAHARPLPTPHGTASATGRDDADNRPEVQAGPAGAGEHGVPPRHGARSDAVARRSGGRTGTSRMGRRAPAAPADHAVRLLLMSCGWWDELTALDHQVLLALPEPHGTALAWLERQITDIGPQTWAVLARGLGDEPFGPWLTGLMADAQRLDADHEPDLDALRHVVGQLVIDHLKLQETLLIAQAGSDPGKLESYRSIHALRREREQALAASVSARHAD